MSPEEKEVYEAWLASRPPAVQALGRKYPPGTKFLIDGEDRWLVGVREHQDGTASVLVSHFNPSTDYYLAVVTAEPICQCCERHLIEFVVEEEEAC